MTRFFEHKRPDQETLSTRLHRTRLFGSDHPILTQIIRRNNVITDLYALGTETRDSTNHPVYPNTVYDHAPPAEAQPITHFKPFTEQSFNQVKAPYHNDIISTHGFGPTGRRTYHVVLTDRIKKYYEDETLRPAD